MPTISVIVPVYNVENYLGRCIDSILAQTYKDFELILVDDGSIDDSGNICDNYAKRDERIIVVHQNNQGQAAARNYGITIANSEWIHFVDSDDLIHPQMLELLYSAALKHNVDISMCGMIEEDSIPEEFFFERDYSFQVYEVTEDYFDNLYSNGGHRYSVVCAKLIRKYIISSIPFENGRIHEDAAVVCRWLYLAKKVADTSDALYYYMPNPNGTMRKVFSKKKLDNLWAMNETLLLYKKIGFNKMLQRVFIAYMNIATQYYFKAKNELKNSSLARDVQTMMRETYKEYNSNVSLENDFREYILGIMYPLKTKIIAYTKKIAQVFSR